MLKISYYVIVFKFFGLRINRFRLNDIMTDTSHVKIADSKQRKVTYGECFVDRVEPRHRIGISELLQKTCFVVHTFLLFYN